MEDFLSPLENDDYAISPSGLFLPQRAEDTDPLNPAEFIGFHLTHEMVYGRQVGWEDAVDRLQLYDLGAILRTIGNVSAALNRADVTDQLAVQLDLCRWLFKEDIEQVLRAYREALIASESAGSASGAGVRAFHELQLVNAAKLALLEVSPSERDSPNSPVPLAEALLIVNDLLEEQEVLGGLPEEIEDADARREWCSYFIVSGAFHATGNPMYELARANELYLTNRPEVPESDRPLDLPATTESLTGLPLEQLITRLAAVHFHWARGPDDETGEMPQGLDTGTYFVENYDFTSAEEDAFWSLVGATPEELRREFEDAGCGDGELRPFYMLPFEKRPLVLHRGQALTPSAQLLAEKVASGLHFLFLNRLPPDDHLPYLRMLGYAFEDYVDGSLARMFGQKAGRYIPEDTLSARAPEGARVCDAVIVYAEGAILLEVKASRLKLRARTEGDWDEIQEFLDRVFVESGGPQLDSTVDLIEDGLFTDLGLDPQRLRRYVPVIVTLEPLFMQPLLYNVIADQLEEEGLLSHPKADPVQQLNVEDLELLEAAVERGSNLFEVLTDRTGTGGHRLPFKQYAWQTDRELLAGPNEYLRERFSEIADTSIEYLSKRRTEPGEEATGS